VLGLVGTLARARCLTALVLGLVLDRVSYVPERLLVRSLRVRWPSVARALGERSFTVTSLATAMLGAGGRAVAW
jgi:PST family polysaccharide transporter